MTTQITIVPLIDQKWRRRLFEEVHDFCTENCDVYKHEDHVVKYFMSDESMVLLTMTIPDYTDVTI